jgi:hypothetical protein
LDHDHIAVLEAQGLAVFTDAGELTWSADAEPRLAHDEALELPSELLLDLFLRGNR